MASAVLKPYLLKAKSSTFAELWCFGEWVGGVKIVKDKEKVVFKSNGGPSYPKLNNQGFRGRIFKAQKHFFNRTQLHLRLTYTSPSLKLR